MFKQISAPISASWEVTSQCNFNCVHCYNYWRRGESEVISSHNQLNVYRKTVTELINNKVFSVVITGGEPLMVFEEIVPFISELKKANIFVSINSNLSLLNDRIAEQISKLQIPVLTSISSDNPITNDKITNHNNSLQKIMAGIKLARSYNIDVHVNMVVSKINIGDIFGVAAQLSELGIKVFSATKACKPLNCEDFSQYDISIVEFNYMINQLLKVQKELALSVNSLLPYPVCAFDDNDEAIKNFSTRSCSGGKMSCAIGYDGEIRPCTHSDEKYGNIMDGLKSAWQKMRVWRDDTYIPDDCNMCKIKYYCGWGCRIAGYAKYGSMKAVDPLYKAAAKPISFPRTEEKLNENISRYMVNPNIRFREEDFGGILYAKMSYVPVTVDLYQAIINKLGASQISSCEIAQTLNVQLEDAKRTMEYLHKNNIVVVK